MSSDGAKPWSAYMLETYIGRQPLALQSFYVDEVEKEAREKLKDHKSALFNVILQILYSQCFADAFLYVFGSAGNCSADHWNRSELEKWRIIPRMLRDATVRNLEVCPPPRVYRRSETDARTSSNSDIRLHCSA